MDRLSFISDFVKPWEDLNILLGNPYAVQPNRSEMGRSAGAIAVALRHFPEKKDGVKSALTDLGVVCKSLVMDSADYFKHGSLTKAARNAPLIILSAFEVNDNQQFRFIRNIINVDHATHGQHDFMIMSRNIINSWIHKYYPDVRQLHPIMEAVPVFKDDAEVNFNENYSVGADSFRLGFFKKDASGELVPTDTDFRFKVHT